MSSYGLSSRNSEMHSQMESRPRRIPGFPLGGNPAPEESQYSSKDSVWDSLGFWQGFPGIPWDSLEFHGIPWDSLGFHGIPGILDSFRVESRPFRVESRPFRLESRPFRVESRPLGRDSTLKLLLLKI